MIQMIDEETENYGVHGISGSMESARIGASEL